MGEHQLCKLGVAGSSPARSIFESPARAGFRRLTGKRVEARVREMSASARQRLARSSPPDNAAMPKDVASRGRVADYEAALSVRRGAASTGDQSNGGVRGVRRGWVARRWLEREVLMAVPRPRRPANADRRPGSQEREVWILANLVAGTLLSLVGRRGEFETTQDLADWVDGQRLAWPDPQGRPPPDCGPSPGGDSRREELRRPWTAKMPV